MAIRTTIGTLPVFDGTTIEWTAAPGYTYRIVLRSAFYNWSSNYYTEDYVVEPDVSTIDCHLFPCFDLITVGFSHLINDEPPILWFQPFATPGDARVLAMPPAPSTYWLEELGGF